ncbi:hypothetical protein GYMLUDRAFT_881041 [Collybiopsis luxurians FD-317 M1]|uniref:Uncharacterized protein n=1 Tax=Collybiopsis luxurians FD-317 M1 TaxID=944289 RepID=A0A0D0BK63_9AGAR|nr:hypothetical protein GYMLUDRAFT_881041 [Collybiopsis luxurians FD-317 M1]
MSASSDSSGFFHHTTDFGLHGNSSKAGSSYGKNHRDWAGSQIAEGHISESLAPVVSYSDIEGSRTCSKTKQLAPTTNNGTPDDIAPSPAKKHRLTKGKAVLNKGKAFKEKLKDAVSEVFRRYLNDES